MIHSRYDIFEKRGDAGVLLAHGITGAPTELKPLVRKLAAAGFTVACPQLAGHCSTLKELRQTRSTDWYASLRASLHILRCQRTCRRNTATRSFQAIQFARPSGSSSP